MALQTLLRLTAAASLLCLQSGDAFSGSAAAAMKQFGLLGTWSTDCADKGSGAVRYIYDVPIFGNPTSIWSTPSSQNPDGPWNVHRSQIIDAERITDEKLRLLLRNGETVEMIYIKVGAKVKTLKEVHGSSRPVIKGGYIFSGAGNTGIEVPLLEKCLN